MLVAVNLSKVRAIVIGDKVRPGLQKNLIHMSEIAVKQ